MNGREKEISNSNQSWFDDERASVAWSIGKNKYLPVKLGKDL